MESLPWNARPVADSNMERCETVSVLQCGSVADLKIAAQQALGQRFLRLPLMGAF